jgi:hypothetical protein
MKLTFIFFILLLSGLFYITRYNVDVDVKPDIIISPGGYNGFYQLGICHYIKNNFEYSNKQIFGFSAGSWAGIFLCLDNKLSNRCIRNIFKHTGRYCSIPHILSYFKHSMNDFKDGDFNLSHLHVGMTNMYDRKIYVKNKFLSIDDCIQSCIGSSFVPMVTYNDILYFYNHKSVVDGGLCYRKYIQSIDPDKVLIVSPRLFKYNQKKASFIRGLFKPKRSLYDLYLLGYHNAKNNHDYLSKYFHSDSF